MLGEPPTFRILIEIVAVVVLMLEVVAVARALYILDTVSSEYEVASLDTLPDPVPE